MSALPETAQSITVRLSSGQNIKRQDGEHDHEPIEVSLQEFAERLSKPTIGAKGSAGYFLVAEFAQGKRKAENICGPAQLVMIDLDQGDWSAEDIRLELDGVAFFAHTTASHKVATPSNPHAESRWRVLIPLGDAKPTPEEHGALALSLHRTLGWDEELVAEAFDKCGTRIAQPIFYPTAETAEAAERFEFLNRLDRDLMPVSEMARRVEDEQDRQSERKAAQAVRRLNPGYPDRSSDGVIDQFNEARSLQDMMVEYGYDPPTGNRTQWTSPRSQSQTPALNVLVGDDGVERVYSHRGSDDGTPWQCMDAFELYRMHAHDGDMASAVRAAARELNLPALRPVEVESKPRHPRKKFRFVQFADIEPVLSNTDLIKGVIGAEKLGVIYGQSGSTKSFFALEMAVRIASGQPWRGHRTRKGGVIYVAAEGAVGMHNRVEALKRSYALGPQETLPFWLMPGVVQLTEEGQDDVATFIEAATDEGINPSLVVIDTLSQSMAGADENGPKDMSMAIALAQQIMSGLSCAVVIVHHSGKNEAMGARGHSSLRAATDTELEVKETSDSTYRIRASKQKEGETGAEWFHRLETVELGLDQDGDPITSAILKPMDGREAAEAQAAAASGKKKPSKLSIEVVEAVAELHKAKRVQPIPTEALTASGYREFIHEQGWALNTPVKGVQRDVLAVTLRERADREEKERDGQRDGQRDETEQERKARQDKARQRSKRRIDTAIRQNVLMEHEGWVWLREPERDGNSDA